MNAPEIQLLPPADTAQWSEARQILREYAEQLGVDLCFQGFEAELVELPNHYGPPQGFFLLAWLDGALAGCVGFRALADVDYPNACEMKRLFVRPAFRRFGLGRLLAQALIERAQEAGYSTMLLDTLDDMEAARGLYETLGFEEVPPYYYNPIPGAHYLKVDLLAPRTSF
ncbi:ribosomal protein S18 acetylase RimI-like enzyme [Inhella inkyongensis]|uniref:Ribosomal protein S18 acetylase RimI-like enzyme n=1 Tax=Inhella inkyongensis TaxID=392593 RepID=A0A840S5R8_9BURK|nr:GNAT family N-acetyltransferase [Inhella inkyongensis]MBB5205745.1 ribosomal protein S18 acetylase RimI-like enzyme [Inhella inkyongensis]